jgi:hypothetical protein
MKKALSILIICLCASLSIFATNYTLKNQVVVSNSNVSFTVKKISDNSLLGTDMQVILENKTEKNLMYSIDNVAVNGFAVEPFWATSVSAGKKAVSTITFYTSDIEKYGITSLDEIEFTLRIYNKDDWMEDDVLNQKYIIYPTGKVPGSVSHPSIKITDEDVLYINDSNCLFAVVGDCRMDDIMGYIVPLYIENKTDVDLTVTWDNVSVNGFMVDPFFATTVPAHQKKLANVTFFTSSLEESYIDEVERIEFDLRIYDSDNWFAEDYVNKTYWLEP